MSLKTKCCSVVAVVGAFLLMASCAEAPTVPSDDVEVGPVLKKGGPKGPNLLEVDVAIPSDFAGNALIGDGLELTEGLYEGGKCGVVALAGSSFTFWPFYGGGMNKKELRDFEAAGECGWNHDNPPDSTAVRRRMSVDLAAAKVHDPENPDHVDEMTLAQMIDDLLLDPIGPDDIMKHAQLSNFDGSGAYLSRGSFWVPYCNYVRFDAAGAPGSNDLEVDNSTAEMVRVETQDWPDNVGLCAHDIGGSEPLVILLHLDIAYDVINQ